jgi:hypothetical protein
LVVARRLPRFALDARDFPTLALPFGNELDQLPIDLIQAAAMLFQTHWIS